MSVKASEETWEDLPALHVYPLPGRYQTVVIMGSLGGLAELHSAIISAMVEGKGEAEVLLSDADAYRIVVKRQDLATEWDGHLLPIYPAAQPTEEAAKATATP